MKFGRYSADNYEWCCRDKCEYVLSGLDWMRTIESFTWDSWHNAHSGVVQPCRLAALPR